MKSVILALTAISLVAPSCDSKTKEANTGATKTAEITNNTERMDYFIDVHDLEPGKVKFKDVEGAHQKDLATQGKYGVKFHKYWVDEENGKVYCLSQARSADDVQATHKEAHGLVPAKVYQVSAGQEALAAGDKKFFMDIHHMGAGKVTASDVAGAHDKDLAVQHKHGVNFVNYWVDEKEGVIMCLSEAADSNAVKKAHREAHGLLPAYVLQVKQGE